MESPTFNHSQVDVAKGDHDHFADADQSLFQGVDPVDFREAFRRVHRALDIAQQDLALDLENFLNVMEGASLPPSERKSFAKDLSSVLARLEHSVKCTKCDKPGQLQAISNSDDDAHFIAQHTAKHGATSKTCHGMGGGLIPELSLIRLPKI